jgi:hypothetical protein
MRILYLVATVVAIGLLTSAPTYSADRIAYGSTATKSVHYTYAVSATKAINTISGDKVNVTVISTGGSVDNLARIARGQIQMGMVSSSTLFQAYKGLGKFKGKALPDLRSLWIHSPAIQAWVVREDSGITKLEDLEGKVFTPGQRGSATEQLAQQILEVLGIKPKYFRATLGDAVAAVKDGRNNGYVKAGSANSLDGTTLELKALTPIRLLGFNEGQVNKIKKKFPFIGFKTYADGEIQGVPAITTPVQVVGQFTTKSAMTDGQVQAILKGIIDGKNIQAAAFPGIKALNIAKDSLAVLTVPLHSGAVKFYKSRGFDVPSHLIPPEYN